MDRKSLGQATAVGLVLQVLMIVIGHIVPALRDPGFAIGGMSFSAVAGFVYARLAPGNWGSVLAAGAIAGGACAFGGIAVSAALGDVPVSLLALGTVSSVVTGAIGGALGKVGRRV